jgi:hypothetical protein
MCRIDTEDSETAYGFPLDAELVAAGRDRLIAVDTDAGLEALNSGVFEGQLSGGAERAAWRQGFIDALSASGIITVDETHSIEYLTEIRERCYPKGKRKRWRTTLGRGDMLYIRRKNE